jgi:hypothetical protein
MTVPTDTPTAPKMNDPTNRRSSSPAEAERERRRRLARERQQRQRQRLKDGSRPFEGEAPATTLDALVCAGLLSDEALADPQAIGAALVEIAHDFASGAGGGKRNIPSRRDARLGNPDVGSRQRPR